MVDYVGQFIFLVEKHDLCEHHDWLKPYYKAAKLGRISQMVAKCLLVKVQRIVEYEKDHPNHLPRPPTGSELNPKGPPHVIIGHLKERPEVQFGYSFGKNVLSIAIIGGSHGGKTVTQRNFIFGIDAYAKTLTKRFISQNIIQLKFDNTDLQQKLGSNWLYYSAHDGLRIGIEGPEDVPADIWNPHWALITGQAVNLHASRAVLIAIERWGRSMRKPIGTPLSMKNIRDIAVEALSIFSWKPDYAKTLIQTFDGMLAEGGPLLDCETGFNIVRDVIDQHKSCVIDLCNLPFYLFNYIVQILFAKPYVSRLHNMRKNNDTLVVYHCDEYDLLPWWLSEATFPDAMGYQSKWGRQGREMDLCVCIAASSPKFIPPHIKANLGMIICHRLTDPEDLPLAKVLLNLKPGDEQMLMSLAPGECLVRYFQGSWPHTFLGQVNYIEPATRPEKMICAQHPWTPAKPLIDIPELYLALQNLLGEKHKDADRKDTINDNTELSPDALKILELLPQHPAWPLSRLWPLLNKKLSFKAQIRICEELEQSGFVTFIDLRVCSTNQRLPHITPSGVEKLGKPIEPLVGHGKPEHVWIENWIHMVGLKRKLRSSIEPRIAGTNHMADVLWRDGDSIHAFEVICTSLDNVISHLEASFLETNKVTTFTFVAAQKSTLDEVGAIVKKDGRFDIFKKQISYKTADIYMKELWP